tara:strand:+ start:382 stop:792 length:411 start_codon:yes stop_codon:yes gene_type:complete
MILDFLNIGSKIIDKIWPDKDEADKAKIRLLEMQQSGEFKQIEADIKEQEELSKRHAADMASDSWLSKNIRPITLMAILSGYFVFAMMSAFGYDTNQNYVELLGQWGIIIMSFYFGGRSIEKVFNMIENRKSKEGK